jgi:thioredoxin-like negative regulator of GroEL
VITSYREFSEKVRRGVKLVVFTADWVPQSKRLYEELARALESFKCDVLEVDVAMVPSVVERERVFHVPTVKLYIDGKCVFTQEDTTGSVDVDAKHVMRAFKEAIKKRGLPLR